MSGLLVAVVGTLAASLGSYLLAAKRFSGQVKTTEASKLWDAAESIRRDLTLRNEYLRKVIDGLEARVSELDGRIEVLENRNDELHRENEDLKDTLRDQERTITTLRAKTKALENENIQLRNDNATLKKRLERLEAK